ncbi:hypothetical protein GCM10027044_21710 [Hymenobacter ruber]
MASSSEVPAPAGMHWSEVQNDLGNTTVANSIAGLGYDGALSTELADDFMVPAGQSWTVRSFSFFGYQAGAKDDSPFTGLYVQVWRGQPGTAGATVVSGSAMANCLGHSTDALVYRLLNSRYPTGSAHAPDITRKVWEIEALVTPDLVLPAGTYWVSWTAWAPSGTGTNCFVPVTTVGARTQTGANALQQTTDGADIGPWLPLLDAGIGTNPAPVGLDMAFKIFGTNRPLATRVGQPGPDGLRMQAHPVPATEAVQITLDHLHSSAQLLLTDLKGRLVWSGQLPAGSTSATVPVAACASGLYVLEARTATGSTRIRIVKN